MILAISDIRYSPSTRKMPQLKPITVVDQQLFLNRVSGGKVTLAVALQLAVYFRGKQPR